MIISIIRRVNKENKEEGITIQVGGCIFMFTAIFTKGNNSCDLFACLGDDTSHSLD